MAIYSLLVGINEYKNPRVNSLNGCKADVELFKATLKEKFSVAEDNIKTLLNEEATRDSLIDTFNSHLINNLSNSQSEDDVAIFYFSGHGSQVASPEAFWDIEPDHLDETLICHDSRYEGTPDLRDKELRLLIHKLSQHCQHILVVLDCCHGGHGTRVFENSLASVRMVQADKTPQTLESYLFHDEIESALKTGQGLPQGEHILLAGCQDFQLSREREQGEDNQVHGLFTYALCKTLIALPYPVSYRELLTRIHVRVQQQQLSQSPQLEAIGGANDRESVFGGDIQPLNLLVYYDHDGWAVNAGAMHGFSEGDQIAVFEGKADELADIETSKAPMLRIHQLGTFKSSVVGDEASLEVDKQYNGLVTRRNFKKTGIALKGKDEELESVRALLENDSPATVGDFLTIEATQPRYELHAEGGKYYTTSLADPRPIFEKQQTARAALEQLATMARWWQKLELENLQSSIPDDAVEIVINYNGEPHVSKDVSMAYALEDDASGEVVWKQPEFSGELRLKANYPKSLYCALLYFDGCTGDIHANVLMTTTLLTHKQGGMEGQVNAVSKVPLFEGKSQAIKIKKELWEQGVTRVQDYLKLIVSETPFDASILEQAGNKLYRGTKGGTRSGLTTALQQMMGDVHYRSLDFSAAPTKATDWTTKTVTLTIHRPQEAQATRPDRAISLNSDERLNVQAEAHPSFKGSLRLVSTQNENEIRKVSTFDSSPSLFGDSKSVVDFSRGYQSDLGLDALEIFVGSRARSIADCSKDVSADQPLNITMNAGLEDGEVIVPYTYDGEYFLPVGFSSRSANGNTTIHIEALPDSAFAAPDDTTKSLGRALKIYFRKLIYQDVLGRDVAIQELGIPEFDIANPKRLSHSQTSKAEIVSRVSAANKILLVTHGIIGKTSTMVGFVNHKSVDGRCIHDDYDLVLTFDYENLNTRIQDTALALKEALSDVGISEGTNKQLDVVAHSMGGLVTRWFIEREGGDAVIQKLVMVGTPNGGSPFADVKAYGYGMVKTWAYSNLAVAMNGLMSVDAGGVAVHGLMKLLDSIDNTLDQMAPDSDFMSEIKHSRRPPVSYAIVAGNTDSLEVTESNSDYRIARLFHHLRQKAKLKAFDVLTALLFKESNDMAASLSSMTQFNSQWVDTVALDRVDCSHLSYFGDDSAIKKIQKNLSD